MKTIKWMMPVLLAVVAVSCHRNKPQAALYTVPAPENVVMYQINPRVFAPDKSLQAIIPQLDSIKSLGTNVVWIMPIYPIGKEKSKNSPYSIADYQAVNPEFGTFEDFKMLVDECHKRGMAFIMDWVANHTAWDNVWMASHKDWYTKNAKGEIIYPEGTDWTDVADLNYDNPDMRKAMTEAMIYWVREAGVDGFRCDVADAVPADFWKEAITAIRNTAARPILMLAEGNDPETFKGGFDMNYGWDYMNALRDVFCRDSSARKLIAVDADEYAKIPLGKVKLRFITNHDEATKKSTVDEFGGKQGALAAYVSAIFTHGAALLYGEQEVAYPDTINFFRYQQVDWNANADVRAAYRRINHIFRDHPVLHGDGVDSFTDDDVLMYEKRGENNQYLVMVNVRDSSFAVKTPSAWQNVEFTNLVTGKKGRSGARVPLKPYEYRILMK